MNASQTDTILKYLTKCQTSDWIYDEVYKFQFAIYLNTLVEWDNQTDEEVLEILKHSQKIRYTNSTDNGIQFIRKSGKDLKDIILIDDVRNFRKVTKGEKIENIDWSNRGMSYTGLSAWLSTLFPDKMYPVPMTGFNETINYLFDNNGEKIPKQGLDYILKCQPYFAETEHILRQFPIQEKCLEIWNKHNSQIPDLRIESKTEFSNYDWTWLVQDFHLFTLREILGHVKDKHVNIQVADTLEQSAPEGEHKLAIHLKYERDSTFIKKIKEVALKENKMLNCKVCGFSFLSVYGEVGAGFIEAHHINPLNERKGKQVTQKKDIALICSNCHRMLHRKVNDKYLTIDQLKEIIRSS
jgi:hypothetical protein